MSTWTSSGLLLAAAIGLAACGAGIDVGRRALQSVAVADRSVVVGGPPGYCVDPAASHDGADAFVLLGSCASILQDPDEPRPSVPAILAVTVSSDASSSLDVAQSGEVLEAYVRSEAGRASLSREGRADTVTILEVRRTESTMYIRVRDTSAGQLGGSDDAYWRALLDVNGRLVTVSVIGARSPPMQSEDGLRLLDAAAQRIRTESARLPG